jgi:hypothetical protein
MKREKWTSRSRGSLTVQVAGVSATHATIHDCMLLPLVDIATTSSSRFRSFRVSLEDADLKEKEKA